jgi:anti-anti-sigma regulatory factor
MQLTERQVGLGAMLLLTIGAAILSVFQLVNRAALVETLVVVGSALLCGALLFAYWRRWTYANYSVVLLTTLLVVATTPEQYVLQAVTLSIFVPPVLALILTRPITVFISGAIILIGLIARAGGQGVYVDPSTVTIYIMVIGGMTLARHITDNARRIAETQAQRAENALTHAEQQARELAEANQLMNTQLDQQQELLNLVTTLETPAVPLAEGVLFAPIVGHVDTRRAQLLTSRLLEEASNQRARLVVLDIAGVSVMDTAVAKSLLNTAQALRLLGCEVTLSGISATVAMTLIQLGVNLKEVRTARSPQEALAQYLGSVPLSGKTAPNSKSTYN